MKASLRVLAGLVCMFSFSGVALAQTGGIRGQVKDPSGALIAAAKITVTTQGTGAQRLAVSDKDGSFELVSVPVGQYTVEIEAPGFKKFVQKDVTVDIGHVAVVNANMVLGESTTTVTVEATAAQVETTSTQLGAVVNERSVTELPLNARDVYQLLQIQPGVQSQVGIDLFYGSDKAGVVSVNGGRGRSNNYSVNGGEGNDMFANVPAIQPSPDSIEEFRVITNTFDAEYGRNSGAEVNVVTKSGTNDWHGSVYEFFRNKVLNARGFLDVIKPDSKQNQYGGTIGGPIKKDKTFIFGSYEGRRAIKGVSTQPVTFPTGPERTGDFSAGSTFSGTISPTIASILMNRGSGACNAALPAAAQANLAAAAGGGTQTYDTIFPGNIIPAACFDPVAADLLRLISPSALPPGGLVPGTTNTFQFVPNSFNNEDQFTIKLDHHLTSTQRLTGYYYYEHDNNLDPRAFFQAGGANIGTFGGLFDQATQQVNVSHTWTIGSAVNEARFTYFREGQGKFNHPQHTNLTTNSCTGAAAKPFCFTGTTDPPASMILNSTTLAPIAPPSPSYGVSSGLGASREGVPNIVVGGGFSLGNNFEGEFVQFGNTFEWSDTFGKVIGKHTLKFGGDFRYQKFDQTLFFDLNGQDIIGNTGFGNSISSDDAYPNYLLGLVDFYLQGGAQNEFIRSKSTYLFGEDSWKLKPNLTLNYGLRWELNTPLADAGQKVQTYRPGQVSTIFPCALTAAEQTSFGVTSPDCNAVGVNPVGLVFPGDKGIPNGLTQTYYKSFGPRVGLAWSPGWTDGWLKSLFGGPGKTSIRMGYGIFYNPIEQLVLEQFSAEPPFGGSAFFSSVLLQAPYITQTGLVNPNPFGGGILNPPRNKATDFARFRPILLFGDAQPHMRSQYEEHYNLTIQRELPGNIVFQVAYVGTQGHRLLASYDLNHGNPQTCLDLDMILGSGTCGPGFEDSVLYQIPATTTLPVDLHLPYAQPGEPLVIPAGTLVSTVAPNGINFVGTRKFSAPLCDPYKAFPGNGCPLDTISVFSNIFAQDTVANSNYNSFQLSVDKKFSHGLQLQGAYTFSRSIDNASSFENNLNPVNFSTTRGLSLFDARHRFVLSYYWEFPVPKMQGFAGKLLNGWASSGIATVQSGFPIRIQTSTIDNELFSSFDFEAPGEPNILGPFRTQDPRRSACALGTGPTATSPNPTGGPCIVIPNAAFDPNLFSATPFDPSTGPPAGPPQIPGTVPLGTIGNSPRTVCCGPGIANLDISILKNTQLTERIKMEFRAEFFNVFNHAQFIGVQGDISGFANSGATFGSVLRVRDPRLIQFAVKFIF